MKNGIRKFTTTQKLLVLFCFMVMSMIAFTSVYAYPDDASNCSYCDHIHWGDKRCDECGGCSIDCDIGCYLEHHCHEEPHCFEHYGECKDCGKCIMCAMGDEKHCPECDACSSLGDALLCGDCRRCDNCSGGICDECGFCYACIEVDDIHCVECWTCFSGVDGCVETDSKDTHCANDCLLCEECGKCFFDDPTGFCQYCENLCIDCCKDRSEAEGCLTGNICVESSDWDDEHFCDNCGEDIKSDCGGKDVCEYCGLCLDCCMDGSDCIEGTCTQDPEYEEHFCADCGECFDSQEKCENCELASDYRCKICCNDARYELGCDCPEMATYCINDDDFKNHLTDAHDGGNHARTSSSAWLPSPDGHRHPCRYCNNEEHYSVLEAHSYDSKNCCKICGYTDEPIYIVRQPKNVTAQVTTTADADKDLSNYMDKNYVKLSVVARSKDGQKLSYQWYVKDEEDINFRKLVDDKDGAGIEGATTSILTQYISTDECTKTKEYYCVITNEKENCTLETTHATLKVSHAYSNWKMYDGSEEPDSKVIWITYIPTGETEAITYKGKNSKGHTWICIGDNCEHRKSTTLTKHTFKAQKEIGKLADGTGKVYARECELCGYIDYRASHIHKYYDENGNPNVSYEYVFEDGTATTADIVKANDYRSHPLKCINPDCDKYILVPHTYGSYEATNDPKEGQPAGIARTCTGCEYTLNSVLDSEGNEVLWTIDNALLFTKNASASIFFVEPGSIVTLTPDLATGYVLAGWKVEYEFDYQTTDVTDKFIMVEEDGKYRTTFPSWSEIGKTQGGGKYYITATIEKCTDHSETKLINVEEQVCLKEGYTGDIACKRCGYILTQGDIILVPDGASHEGPFTILKDTAVTARCNQRGKEADKKCDKCNEIIKGKSTGYGEHIYPLRLENKGKAATCYEGGYESFHFCGLCHKVVYYNHETKPLHADGANYELIGQKVATCTDYGYTGDKKCTVSGGCGDIFEIGHLIPPTGHTWGEWQVITAATETSNGTRTRKCSECNETETKLYTLNSEYEITFDLNGIDSATVTLGKEEITTTPVKLKTTIKKTLSSIPVATSTISEFTGWKTEDGDDVLTTTKFTSDSTVYAIWEENGESTDEYIIYFNSNGANIKETETTTVNKKIKADDFPTTWKRTGYTLDGWYYKDGSKTIDVDESTIFRGPARIYAKWKLNAGSYIITFKANGGKVNHEEMTTLSNGKLTALLDATDKTGYEFLGWYTEPEFTNKVTIDTIYTQNTTLYASWKYTAGYEVTFNANGGNVTPTVMNTDADGKLTSLPTPTKDGYTFEGWYKASDDTSVTLETVFTENTKVYANWTEDGTATTAFVITFNPNGGTVTPTTMKTVMVGKVGKLKELPTPTRDKYAFEGWFTEKGVRILKNTTYTADTEVIAKWIFDAGYIVTFNANGGEVATASSMANEEGKLAKLPTPTRSGYKFAGWFDAKENGNKITLDNVYTENTEIFAYWTKVTSGTGGGGSTVVTYKITVTENEGASITPNGTVKVVKGEDQTFRIKAKERYEIEDVLVDGESIGYVEAYTFENVKEAHTLEAKLKKVETTPEEETYGDVKETDWYATAVGYVTKKKVMNGTGNNEFGPNLNTTRGMVATILYRLEGSPEATISTFTDVEKTAYYAKAIAWAEENGIVNGYGEGKFGPNDIITREQLVAIMYRYSNYKKYDTSVGEDTNILDYDDAKEISSYAIPAIQWACGESLITGIGNNLLAPKGNTTRAQLATILMRYCESNK